MLYLNITINKLYSEIKHKATSHNIKSIKKYSFSDLVCKFETNNLKFNFSANNWPKNRKKVEGNIKVLDWVIFSQSFRFFGSLLAGELNF